MRASSHRLEHSLAEGNLLRPIAGRTELRIPLGGLADADHKPKRTAEWCATRKIERGNPRRDYNNNSTAISCCPLEHLYLQKDGVDATQEHDVVSACARYKTYGRVKQGVDLRFYGFLVV